MSVPRSSRSTSDMEFIAKARELESETRRKCVNSPKRYTFYGLQELWMTSRRIYAYVKKANSVFPTNKHELQIRRDYLIRANCELQDYISQVELLTEDFVLIPEHSKKLMAIVDTELRLVKAVMKKDRERWKNLSE